VPTVSTPASGFLRGLRALCGAGVDFVVVGVGGINFYARDAGQAVATLDLDALLAPAARNLGTALRALSEVGYAFEAGDEPFLDIDDETTLRRVVERGAAITAVSDEGGQLDLLTSIAGFAYGELAEDASAFRVSDVEVRVGRLEKLLRSKQLSGRAKDVEFLRAYEARGSDEDESSR